MLIAPEHPDRHIKPNGAATACGYRFRRAVISSIDIPEILEASLGEIPWDSIFLSYVVAVSVILAFLHFVCSPLFIVYKAPVDMMRKSRLAQ
jgi:hypothetical protein